MAEQSPERAAFEWELVECPVPYCGERGPRIHVRDHLRRRDDECHARYDETDIK